MDRFVRQKVLFWTVEVYVEEFIKDFKSSLTEGFTASQIAGRKKCLPSRGFKKDGPKVLKTF